jgi:hypothetical protein
MKAATEATRNKEMGVQSFQHTTNNTRALYSY